MNDDTPRYWGLWFDGHWLADTNGAVIYYPSPAIAEAVLDNRRREYAKPPSLRLPGWNPDDGWVVKEFTVAPKPQAKPRLTL